MKIIMPIFLLLFSYSLKANDMTNDSTELRSPEELAQMQLDAYNSRDIERFLIPYSDSVEVYSFPEKLLYKGKHLMKPRYSSMFENTPELHCELVNRIVLGNTIIDQEKVSGFPEGKVIEAIAIYEIENGKIARVYFK